MTLSALGLPTHNSNTNGHSHNQLINNWHLLQSQLATFSTRVSLSHTQSRTQSHTHTQTHSTILVVKLTLLVGCAWRPVVLQNNQMHPGLNQRSDSSASEKFQDILIDVVSSQNSLDHLTRSSSAEPARSMMQSLSKHLVVPYVCVCVLSTFRLHLLSMLRPEPNIHFCQIRRVTPPSITNLNMSGMPSPRKSLPH